MNASYRKFDGPERVVFACAVTVCLGALAVAIGWSSDVDILRSGLPGFPEMKPAGVNGFLLLALGLFLSIRGKNDRNFRWATTVIGVFVAAFALTVLVSNALDLSAILDTFLVRNFGPSPASTVQRFSPIAALGFLLLGGSMALLRWERMRQVSGVLAVLALTATYGAVIGHLYHADTFYGFSGINGMPLPSAFLSIVMGAGLLWRNQEFHLVRLLRSDSLGGAAARRLIPCVVLIPTLIGWLRVAGQDRGLFDTGFGTAISMFTIVILTLAIVLFFSRTIHIADRKRQFAEAELAEKEMRYRELFDYSQGLICVHDLDGVLTTVNRAAHSMLGYTAEEMTGRDLRDFVPPEHHLAFDSYLRQITHEGLAEGLLELRSKTGQSVYLRYNNVLAMEAGKEPYVLGHAQDVTELLAAKQQLENLSLTDDLTGLYNRRGFRTLAEQQLRLENHRGTARGLTLLFADMDGLKSINDTYGHDAGSEALCTFAQLLRSALRGADLISRWGGDEFVILTIGAKDENSDLVVERIRRRLDEYNATSGKPYAVACSIGVCAVTHEAGLSFDEMIARADAAMYEDKVRRKAQRGAEFSPRQAAAVQSQQPSVGH